MIILRTKTETYHVDDDGNIDRPSLPGFKPSGQWRFLGLRRYNNFGRRCEYRSMAVMLVNPVRDLTWKNGKAKWVVCDLDHGTYREWMNPGLISVEIRS